MNVLFLSPAFPPNAYLYCTALAERGITVLAIGDEPPEALRSELRAALTEYVFAPAMGEYAVLREAVAALVRRHGPIDRLDSNGEHWLEAEGRLRDDFGVFGLSGADVRRHRSKLAMGERFAAAGIATPPIVRNDSEHVVRRFAERHGFPLVFKPDAGSGAADTFAVHGEQELARVLATPRPELVVQPFIAGDIVTFDGLVDRDGHIVFCSSHAYDNGIMQVREGRLDGHYYSLRTIPPELDAHGRAAVAAFELRERFFHVEFFVRADGSLVALEMNVRPPGGFTTDMMGMACDIDVYALWAAMLGGESLTDFDYERKYHVAHAGRRNDRAYREPLAALVAELGATLASIREVPEAFAVTMGDVACLLRHSELEILHAAIARVQALA